jgi:hypothetical protein
MKLENLKSIHPSGKSAWKERTRKNKGIMAREPEQIACKNNHRAVNCRDDGDGDRWNMLK